MISRIVSVAIVLIAVLVGALSVAAQEESVLTVVTHDSFSISEDVLAEFESTTGIHVRILRAGDAGAMVTQSVLTRNNPLGDVMYGVDNTFLSRALEAELFVPYESPLLTTVPEEFVIDAEHRVTPINYGDVCLNYDVAFFRDHKIAVPESLKDLTNPENNSFLVVENPATSSPGLAFLLATIGVFGDTDDDAEYTYLDFWRELVENDVLVVDDWSSAYYGQFSGSSGDGDRPLAVSYASSPVAEVYFAEDTPDEPPTGSITAPGTCFRQIEFAGILSGTQKVEEAQQFIDFMLGRTFQEDIPLQMFVFPVNQDAELPEVFEQYAAIPEEPVTLDPETIEAHREEWIRAWTEVVLQ